MASTLDKTDAKSGDGIIYYPSGRFAAVVCKQGGGRVITITADNAAGQILLNFNHLGVGSITYANGKPWVVVNTDGWVVSDRSGKITERGKFPRTHPDPVVCQVNENLTVTFQDQYSVTATFSVEDETAGLLTKTFECGQKLRRTAPYTDKVVGRQPNGKLELDVAAIRARQAQVGLSGSQYVPPGPHHFKSEKPGLGELKATLRGLPGDSAVSSTVSELQSMDARVDSIKLMPKPTFGSAARAGDASTDATTNTTSGRHNVDVPGDFGSPELSATQRKLAHHVRPINPHAQMHKPRRAKLPRLSMVDAVASISGSDAPRDTLMVLLLMADWSPACSKLEPAAQVANGELLEEAAASPASEAGHVQIFKVDASEGNLLQTRYSFTTIPMALMYYEGKLVAAGNSASTASEIRSSALAALTAARKGHFLPDNFSFAGCSNSQLDFLTPTWSPLSSVVK